MEERNKVEKENERLERGLEKGGGSKEKKKGD